MSFANYAALQDEIKSFLWDRADVVSKIPTFIQLAEAEMKRLLRTQQVVTRQSYTVNNVTGSVPCDERQIMAVQLDLPYANAGTIDLDYATPEQMAEWSVISPQRPRFYTLEGDQLRFLPVPDQSYSGRIIYRSAFCPLSATNRTNWILERHPDIYLSGALKWAKMWLIDSDQDWSTPFYAGIESANSDQPMRQTNSHLRADDVTSLNRRGSGYSIMTDSYGGNGV